ncbi:MAG: ComF family protein [bacterium]|nr:ComF family protein [bacterium]
MSILDLFFPRKCLGCGREGSYFCSQCLNLVSLDRENICPVCERPSIDGATHPRCFGRTTLDGLATVFAYKGLISKAITKLKYRFVSDLASDLAELVVSFYGENKTFSRYCLEMKPVLVPIPLHPTREKWRGFNQSVLLGQMIAKNLGLGFEPKLLVRVKNTTPQMKLKEKERKENIRGAFRLSPNYQLPITNNSILLFDDVWTSGSTLKEAGRVLKEGGSRTVWGLTLAR